VADTLKGTSIAETTVSSTVTPEHRACPVLANRVATGSGARMKGDERIASANMNDFLGVYQT